MSYLENTEKILNGILNNDITEIIIKKLMRPHNSDKIEHCNDQIMNLYENYNYHLMAYKRNPSINYEPPSEFFQYILIKNNIKKNLIYNIY